MKCKCNETLEKIAETLEMPVSGKPEAIYTRYYQCNGCHAVYEVPTKDRWRKPSCKTTELSMRPYNGMLTAEELKEKAREFIGFLTRADEECIAREYRTK